MKNGQLHIYEIKWGEKSLLSFPFKSYSISGQKLCLLSPQKKGIQLCFKRLENPGTSVYTIMKDLWGICPWTSI